jgi:hypothetical protein
MPVWLSREPRRSPRILHANAGEAAAVVALNHFARTILDLPAART